MPVMAAGVHFSFIFRTIWNVVRLRDRQRVHVGAQADRAIAVAVAQRADDAGAADPGRHLEAEAFEPLCDQRGGPMLGIAEFRMGVEIAPPRGQFGQPVLKQGVDGHPPVLRDATSPRHLSAAIPDRSSAAD
jgi:hypothetical protein